jgi:hypothetical protein
LIPVIVGLIVATELGIDSEVMPLGIFGSLVFIGFEIYILTVVGSWQAQGNLLYRDKAWLEAN